MTFAKEQMMERNLDLAEEHLLHVLEHPEILEQISDDAHVILLPVDDPELFEANLQMANQLDREMSHDASEGPVILVLLPVGSKEPVLA
ncbi:MAG: hypothetical protein MAG451_00119 [Anaerolineales bacterium]|nr:hypothetical protein [Anaerolineales bacterium]